MTSDRLKYFDITKLQTFYSNYLAVNYAGRRVCAVEKLFSDTSHQNLEDGTQFLT